MSSDAPSQAQDASKLSSGDLLVRVEAAEGPDRELGDHVLFATGWFDVGEARHADQALAALAALMKALQARPDRHNARDGSAPQNPEPPK